MAMTIEEAISRAAEKLELRPRQEVAIRQNSQLLV